MGRRRKKASILGMLFGRRKKRRPSILRMLFSDRKKRKTSTRVKLFGRRKRKRGLALKVDRAAKEWKSYTRSSDICTDGNDKEYW